MTIKYFRKCGEVCQKKIAGTTIILMGIISVAAMVSLFIRW
jgi:hypothetical protein